MANCIFVIRTKRPTINSCRLFYVLCPFRAEAIIITLDNFISFILHYSPSQVCYPFASVRLVGYLLLPSIYLAFNTSFECQNCLSSFCVSEISADFF